MSCPFHGWTYNLQGDLIAVPAKDSFTELDLTQNGLKKLDCEVWMGFIFIRFVSGGASLSEQLKPVEDLVKPYQIENMEALPFSGYNQTRPYNWKIIHDIDNEGYHVPVGHPSLQQLYGKRYTDSQIEDISVAHGYINEKPGRLWSVRNYQSILPEYSHLPEDQSKTVVLRLHFP